MTAKPTSRAGQEFPGDGETVRVQKAIAFAGVASRRVAEQLVREGRVFINGDLAAIGQKVNPATDVIEVDGARLNIRPGMRYLMLNKPTGVITTLKDPQGRKTVLDLISVPERVVPVGRLDADTEGLLILTNDGDLAHRLTHPSFEVTKTYLAEVQGEFGETAIKRLKQGVSIDEGRTAVANRVKSRGSKRRTLVEITVHEGRKHVVRLMFAEVGHPVTKLVRTSVGGLRLGRLKPGEFRDLTHADLAQLDRSVEEVDEAKSD